MSRRLRPPKLAALKAELAALKETLRIVKAAADDTALTNRQLTSHFALGDALRMLRERD